MSKMFIPKGVENLMEQGEGEIRIKQKQPETIQGQSPWGFLDCNKAESLALHHSVHRQRAKHAQEFAFPMHG